ncbi:polysaccharide biosynthesis protein MviN [Xylanibacter ruminicola]|uniref:Polysaccharide biosynthesis protein MviN n=1 Tax=Xylanibacter ruminicola TaxID=839 RepID=A0AA37I3V4_XYLRU|nr:polysaccharide biosynthesis protein MviN [Xylanibacter ruminicola]
MEPDGIGIYNFANTYAGYFALVALLGIPTYGVREVSKLRDDKEGISTLVSQIMSIAAFTTIGVTIAYIASLLFVNQLTENFLIFLLAGFLVYLAPFKINWYYQGLEEFGYITFRTLVIRTASVISLFVFVRNKEDLIIYVLISVLAAVLTDIWNYIKMRRSGIRPRLTTKGLKPHMRPLLTLFASSIAISIYGVLDTLMLGFIKGYEEVGFYTNAMNMSKVILTAVTSLSIVAVPRVSYYMQNKDYSGINSLMDKSFSVVSLLSFPAAIGLICVSPSFVPLFFGELFWGSILPLMILSLLIIAIGLNNLTGVQILIGMGFDKFFLYSVIIGAISNFLLNCLLIPFYGSVGASIASVAAETIILVATTLFVYKNTPIRISNWKDILKALIGALILIPLMILLKQFLQGWVLVISYVLLGVLTFCVMEYILKNGSFIWICSTVSDKFRMKTK